MLDQNDDEGSKDLRPFHETIVGYIGRCTGEDVQRLFQLIKETKIPHGHDAIIATIDERYKFFNECPTLEKEVAEVKNNLQEQKQREEQEQLIAKEHRSNLDALQGKTEELLTLLRDRQVGLTGWHKLVKACLKKIREFTV